MFRWSTNKLLVDSCRLFIHWILYFYSNHILLIWLQFQQLSQQVLKQENSSVWGGQIKSSSRYPVPQTGPVQNRERNGENIGCRNKRPLGLSSSAWPSLQQSQLQPQPQLQQNGLGMRAIFLGNHVTKRESTGTGVFLPRHIGNQTDSRRKQGPFIFKSFHVVRPVSS